MYYINEMKPIALEVVTNVLDMFSHCASCRLIFTETGVEDGVNKEVLDQYPPELKEEYLKLSDWMHELTRLYMHRISIRIIDAKSILGLYKSIRYRFRKYPAFIVDKKDLMVGWDRETLFDILDAHLRKASHSS